MTALGQARAGEEPPLTVAGAARRLGVTGRTVYRLCARGELGHYRLGRRLLVPGQEIDRLLAASYRPPAWRSHQEDARA